MSHAARIIVALVGPGRRAGFLGTAALLLILLASRAMAVDVDTCQGQGGTAECTGPTVTPYKYSYVNSGWHSPHVFTSESAALAYLENDFATSQNACSTSRENPAWTAVSPTPTNGDFTVPDPHVPGGPNYSLYYWLVTETQQTKWSVRINGTVATDSSPPCAYTASTGWLQLTRTRSVICPKGFTENQWTPPLLSYCYRAPTAEPDPEKNLGPCRDCDLLVANPVNVATGNKYVEEVDYVGSGAFPLEYTRRYNSLAYSGGTPVGPDFFERTPLWRGSYDRAVLFNEHPQYPAADAYRHDGRVLRFKLISGQFVPQGDLSEKLSRQVDGSGNTLGWTLTTERDEIETYDSTRSVT